MVCKKTENSSWTVNTILFGSSAILVAFCRGNEVEFATEEEDASPIIGEGTEASRRCFDGLNAAVEPFAHRIGDVMFKIG